MMKWKHCNFWIMQLEKFMHLEIIIFWITCVWLCLFLLFIYWVSHILYPCTLLQISLSSWHFHLWKYHNPALLVKLQSNPSVGNFHLIYWELVIQLSHGLFDISLTLQATSLSLDILWPYSLIWQIYVSVTPQSHGKFLFTLWMEYNGGLTLKLD